MNMRLLKAKRVERGLFQRDLARALGISEKSMSLKESSERNIFKASEMLTLASFLNLSLDEFDAIFFDSKLVKSLHQVAGNVKT